MRNRGAIILKVMQKNMRRHTLITEIMAILQTPTATF